MDQEKSVLRWGGLAGILGSILLILVMVVVGLIVPPEPLILSDWVIRFPDIKGARVIENIMYLIALLLEIPLFLALYYALRKTSLAPALFGSVLGIIGLFSMIVSATPHVAHAPISDLYHGSGIPPGDLAVLAPMWQATWGIFNAMLYVGFFVLPIGLGLLGVAMFGTPSFGKGFGRVGVVLGGLGLVSAIFQMIDPASFYGVGSYFACLIFYSILGWKVFNLSKIS